MRKILFVFSAVLFIAFGAYAADGQANKEQKTADKQQKSVQLGEQQQSPIHTYKSEQTEELNFFQKRKLLRKVKKFVKNHPGEVMLGMMAIGAIIMLGGLFLYILIEILGKIVIVLGMVLLIYGALTTYF
ncbi:MAG: hypothetical protein U9N85_13130 [Bacteroidota bacterium]|nr:hypothetical protein [Bacteroidota bacterium]